MPLIKLETSATMDEQKQRALAGSLSAITAEVIGKPESYVMAVVSPAVVSMAGTVGPAAFLEVRSIGGLGASVNRTISKRVSELMSRELGIPADRVYISFNDVAAVDWGYNGTTFG